MFEFSYGNVEEDIRWRRVYLCNVHRSIKGLWHNKPWFIDCQVRSKYGSERVALR